MPNSSLPLDAEQHNREIHENRRHWEKKPLLREEYSRFYQEIAKALEGIPEGDVLECGSGIGNLKSVLPNAITSDLFPNPWLDRQENIYALNYADQSLSGIVLFDVFHHLQYPGWALRELHRVLKPGGRIVIFEPAMGLLGRVALGLFHHEPLGLGKPITWEPETKTTNLTNLGYYAAQGNAWRVFRERFFLEKLYSWKSFKVSYHPALAWLAAGGFRGPNLCPSFLVPIMRCLDTLLAKTAARGFSSRMLIILKK